MSLDPMEMKKMVIEGLIKDLASEKRKQRKSSIKALGDTVGIGASVGLETQAIDALTRVARTDKNRGLRKAAEGALAKIKSRIPSNPVADMLGMFQGGVGFSSKKPK